MHTLALALGKTVSELASSITEDELESWKAYYRHWPFDDLHRYHRPAAMIGASMSGGYNEKLEMVAGTLPASAGGGLNEVDRSVMAALGG